MPSQSEFEIADALFDQLFPLCRSITGPGLRKSLEILRARVPLEVEGVETGTQVYDWTIPQEWHIKRAFLKGPDGESYADFDKTNLSVVNYSMPVDRKLPLQELQQHLHSIAALPTAIPYVTSYYKRNWGFCLPHDVRMKMPEGIYHAFIDSAFVNGELNYGHCVVLGETRGEVLITSYLCHPSLANNELSGPLGLVLLYNRISKWKRRRFTYRFLVAPETIGSIAYLSRYGDHLKASTVGGLVLTCLGGKNPSISYKTSRRETSLLDNLVRALKEHEEIVVRIRPFTPQGGSDERQYCSPGFNLPIGQIARDVYGEYEGYHNSLDTKAFMNVQSVIQSVDDIEKMLRAFEYSGVFRNVVPYGEPQLGRRDLYPNINSHNTSSFSSDNMIDERQFLNSVLMILNYSDGTASMLDIAQRCGCAVTRLVPVIDRLESEGLLTYESKV